MEVKGNFIEVLTVEEANAVDMKSWKLLCYDPNKGYVFARRVRILE
jgi:hypothetical protein